MLEGEEDNLKEEKPRKRTVHRHADIVIIEPVADMQKTAKWTDKIKVVA